MSTIEADKHEAPRDAQMRVLVVDDDVGLGQLIVKRIERDGCRCDVAHDAATALKLCEREQYQLLVIDHSLPDMTGAHLVRELRERNVTTAFVVITGHGDERTAVEMMKLGASEYLTKDTMLLKNLPLVVNRIRDESSATHRLVKTERALAESQRALSALIGNLPGVAYRCLHNDRRSMKLISAGCKSLLGYAPEAFLGDEELAYTNLIHESDREATLAAIHTAVAQQTPFAIDYRIRTKGGKIRWVSDHGSSVYDKDGTVLAIEGYISDITEAAEAREALRTSEERLRQVVDNMPVLMLAIDGEQRIVAWNAECVRVTGYPSDEVLNRDYALRRLFPNEPQRLYFIKRMTSPEEIRDGVEIAISCKDGREKRISWSNVSSRISLPGWRGWCVGVDVTERYRAEHAYRESQQALIAQKQHEKEAVESELTFLHDKLVRQTRLATIGQMAASIAHEIRNPLGAVRNAAYFLKRKDTMRDPKIRQYLEMIEKEVETCSGIIRNLLESTKPKQPIQEVVDLVSMVEDTLCKVHPPSWIQCHIQIKPQPYYLYVDSEQFAQVLRNLLSNAIDAIDQDGKIIVAAERGADYDTITVNDTGCGIPVENMERVFEPLFSTKTRGTGLGLTICRQIVQDHGGRIELESSFRQGSTFRIQLPRSPLVSDSPT